MDLELETWRREWRAQTEPLPALKKKIHRQNLQIAAAIAAVSACLVIATVVAERTRSSFMAGLAAGIAFASVILGSYGWWVRRGAWKPAAQTTLAYLELSFRRAIARARTLRFSFYFLLAAMVLYAASLAWDRKAFSLLAVVILSAMAVELIFLRRLQRRKELEVAETRKLIEQARE